MRQYPIQSNTYLSSNSSRFSANIGSFLKNFKCNWSLIHFRIYGSVPKPSASTQPPHQNTTTSSQSRHAAHARSQNRRASIARVLIDFPKRKTCAILKPCNSFMDTTYSITTAHFKSHEQYNNHVKHCMYVCTHL